jgi:hypothetical protein
LRPGARDQHNQRSCRRLLEGLQKRIGREAVQSVGRRNDGDLIASLVSCEGELVGQLPDLFDADLLRFLDRLQNHQVGVLSRGDRVAASTRAAGRLGHVLAQDQAGDPLSEPVAPSPRSFVDQQTMRQPVGLVGRRKGRHLGAQP